MKINWRVRLKNKTWLLSMVAVVITFVYQMLGLCGIVSPITEDMSTQMAAMIVNVLVALGIVVDPTTQGVNDSKQALEYKQPGNRD